MWQPLKGIRVLSFELAFALPAGTKALHDLGADVVRVSPPARQVDPYVGYIDGVFQGKSAIAVDLTQDAGRSVAQRLAAKADVVCNNFRPHVLEKYGLGAQALRSRDPRLITLQLSGYGAQGPWSGYPAFGPSTEAAGGLNRLLVNPDEVPIRVGSAVFSDQLAGRYAALAILAALSRREQTGRGQALDLSMTAGITHLLGVPMTQALLQGEPPTATGNRDQRCVPQGVYRCAAFGANENRQAPPQASGDEWVAVSVTTDEQWRALVDVLEHALFEDTTHSPHCLSRSLTRAERNVYHDQIDALLNRYCRTKDKDEVAREFQRSGIPAAPVRTVADQCLDPNIQARGTLPLLQHDRAVLGAHAHPHAILPWRIAGRSRRAGENYHAAGADNAAVLKRWLAMASSEHAELEGAGVVRQVDDPELKVRRNKNAFDADFANKLGLPR